jgi:hypothetical protein
MLVYVSLNEFLNVPGRIIAYQSHISIHEKSFRQLYSPQNLGCLADPALFHEFY